MRELKTQLRDHVGDPIERQIARLAKQGIHTYSEKKTRIRCRGVRYGLRLWYCTFVWDEVAEQSRWQPGGMTVEEYLKSLDR